MLECYQDVVNGTKWRSTAVALPAEAGVEPVLVPLIFNTTIHFQLPQLDTNVRPAFHNIGPDQVYLKYVDREYQFPLSLEQE